jgi:hypothetical protein
MRALEQRGQGRDQMDAAFLSVHRRQRVSPPASRAPLQPLQRPAHGDESGANQLLTNESLQENLIKTGTKVVSMRAVSRSRYPR